MLQFLFEQCDFIENDTTVGLYLGFAGTTHADTTPLPFEVGP